MKTISYLSRSDKQVQKHFISISNQMKKINKHQLNLSPIHIKTRKETKNIMSSLGNERQRSGKFAFSTLKPNPIKRRSSQRFGLLPLQCRTRRILTDLLIRYT